MNSILVSIIAGIFLLVLVSIIFDFFFYPRVFFKIEQNLKNNSLEFILRNDGNRDIYNVALCARVDKNLAILRVSHTSLHNVVIEVHKCSEDFNGFYSSGVRLETNNLPPFANATVIVEIGKVDANKVGDVFPASHIDLPPKTYCLEYSYRCSGIIAPFHIKKRIRRYFNGEKLNIKRDYDKDSYSQKFLKDGKVNTITFERVVKNVNLITRAKKRIEKFLLVNDTRKESLKTLRPYINIKPGKIKYGNWTDQEKADDPRITGSCDKIILYFWMRNATDQPASNVDMNVTSQIIDEKSVVNLSQVERNVSYPHSSHMITGKAAGKQPFILALSKKATNYFKNGDIKVQLFIRVDYGNINNNESYWSEGTYIYSPTFKNNAIEVSSGGI